MILKMYKSYLLYSKQNNGYWIRDYYQYYNKQAKDIHLHEHHFTKLNYAIHEIGTYRDLTTVSFEKCISDITIHKFEFSRFDFFATFKLTEEYPAYYFMDCLRTAKSLNDVENHLKAIGFTDE